LSQRIREEILRSHDLDPVLFQNERLGIRRVRRIPDMRDVTPALRSSPVPRSGWSPAGIQGTSLAQLQALARTAGLDLEMVKREESGPFPVHSVIHLGVGHFATILDRSGDRYLVADPVFDEDRWLSAEALETETSGYLLVAEAPSGYRKVDEQEAGDVWGRGCPNDASTNDQTDCEETNGGCGSGSCPGGTFRGPCPSPDRILCFRGGTPILRRRRNRLNVNELCRGARGVVSPTAAGTDSAVRGGLSRPRCRFSAADQFFALLMTAPEWQQRLRQVLAACDMLSPTQTDAG
jgi:hypothetical protein